MFHNNSIDTLNIIHTHTHKSNLKKEENPSICHVSSAPAQSHGLAVFFAEMFFPQIVAWPNHHHLPLSHVASLALCLNPTSQRHFP